MEIVIIQFQIFKFVVTDIFWSNIKYEMPLQIDSGSYLQGNVCVSCQYKIVKFLTLHSYIGKLSQMLLIGDSIPL
jgi:hypothetical protein